RDFAHESGALRTVIGGGPLTMAELLDRVFRLEVGDAAPRWGDKTPANLRWVGPLYECFPAAQTIAIVRDPRDVWLSLAPLGWFGETTWDIGHYIARNGRMVRRWLDEVPPSAFHIVRYEDLVLETERVLREVCEFLQLPFAAEMEQFFHNAR